MAKAKPAISRSPRSRSRSRRIVHSGSDAIRIVPLHTPHAAVAAAKPKLTYRKGPLISAVEVFTIFWGPKWKAAPQSAMIGELNGFFDFVLTSALVDQLTEYSVPKYPMKHGKRSGTTTIVTPA